MNEYVNTALVRHIRNFPNFKWDWKELSMHPNLNQQVLEEFRDEPWDTYLLSIHPNFTFGWIDVLSPDNANWDWWYLSDHATISDVCKHRHRPWDWTALTLSDKICDDDMMKHPDFPWDFNMLGYTIVGYNELRILRFYRNRFHNENWHDFTRHSSWSVIKANLDIPWMTVSIPFKPGDISSIDDIGIIEYFMDEGKPLDWEKISLASTIDIVRSHMHLPWVWKWVPSMDWSRYPDLPWDLNVVALEQTSEMVRRWVAAKTIQKKWKLCVSDPSHPVCIRRLKYEFENFLA